ncbi:MAG: hypothetical protein JWN66_2926 [Sphingomonas bacterium]|uniref:hypothetical protein n=1 Tax=Sphingomonas bacterium TaxID=1895847 RepID=UPI0026100E80|nr:hypothetical protein [Sphingomonas bacterium]MDB5705810.1 hypothetical protein [Sphingomonas bacterium]
MASDTPKAPKPAKPAKKAATTAPPKKAAAAAKASPAPKPPKAAATKAASAKPAPTKPAPAKAAKPKKGPTVTTANTFKAETRNATQTLKDSASKLTKDAGEKARAYAEDGKARAGGVLDELARMMTEAAGTVDEKLGEQYGQYARSAAGGVSDFSDSLKAKKLDDLIEDARGFVKKSPAIAIGTAAAIGFVLVRLIKSGLDAADRDEA